MDSFEYSRQLQEKFELYFLALIFTILGLAIQTGKLGESARADWCELSGWLLLMVSGLIGLWRFEWLPIIHAKSGKVINLEATISNFKHNQATGRQTYLDISTGAEKPLAEIIDSYTQDLGKTEVKLEELNYQASLKYQAHKWTFILGLFLLIAARSIEHIVKLFSTI